jgi:DNA-binding transcriptional MerR regulator
MSYTVKQLAKIAGVSVRTLHYYDQIGLLKPSFIKENGYRYYEEPELLKLQQILFFRELQFSLEDIVLMINSPGFNQLEALKDQRKLLELKKRKNPEADRYN